MFSHSLKNSFLENRCIIQYFSLVIAGPTRARSESSAERNRLILSMILYIRAPATAAGIFWTEHAKIITWNKNRGLPGQSLEWPRDLSGSSRKKNNNSERHEQALSIAWAACHHNPHSCARRGRWGMGSSRTGKSTGSCLPCR